MHEMRWRASGKRMFWSELERTWVQLSHIPPREIMLQLGTPQLSDRWAWVLKQGRLDLCRVQGVQTRFTWTSRLTGGMGQKRGASPPRRWQDRDIERQR